MTKMKRRTFLSAASGLFAVPVFSRIAGAAEPLKVGFILPGPKEDGGWSEAHVRGAMAAKEKYGDAVELTFVENIFGDADTERVIRDLAAQGHKQIFICTVSDVVFKVAPSLPDVKFEQCEGYQLAPNVSTFSLRFHEGAAVEGIIAGLMTKSNKIGIVTSFPISTVMLSLNAFTIMAGKVNPHVEVTPAFLSTFYDPAKESDAARALIDQGCDIVLSQNDGPTVLQIAEQKGVLSFGQAKNLAEFAPKAQLTSVVYNWTPYYTDAIGRVLSDKWNSQDSWVGLAGDGIKLAPYNKAIPQAVIAKAEAIRKTIIDGSFSPFDGPVKSNKGDVEIAEGQRLDGMKLRMEQWFAEGVKS
jgi:simple sugar transport system substrate-binding protein